MPGVIFKIEEPAETGPARHWNGIGWTTDENDPGIKRKAKVEGGHWLPADESSLPSRSVLRPGIYYVSATATDAAGNTRSVTPSRFYATGPDGTVPDIAFAPAH